MKLIGRISVPASAVRTTLARVQDEIPTTPPAIPPASGCVGGFKYHKWVEVTYQSHDRICARGCGARGRVDPNGQVKRVDESDAAVRQANS